MQPIQPLYVVNGPDKRRNDMHARQINALNQDCRELNQLISAESRTPISRKGQLLDQIESKRMAILNKYPDSLFTSVADSNNQWFHSVFNVQLPAEMKQVRQNYGIPENPPKYNDDFYIAFESLDQKQMDYLGHVLQQKRNPTPQELSRVFPPNVLQNYDIRYLNGNNSLNYTVTNKMSGETVVLKLDNRMGRPTYPEQHLRSNMPPGTFTDIYANRKTVVSDPRQGVTLKGLQITEYCPGRDLGSIVYQPKTAQQTFAQAQDYYSQMGDILSGFEQNNMMHPDMKNSNWLVANGKVRISDGKAFMPTDNGSPEAHYRYDYGALRTPGYIPPGQELNSGPANKVHAYIMGCNLYQFLTQCSYKDLDKKNFDFNKPIFKVDPQGPVYKALCERMLEPDPNKRLTTEQATKALKSMGLAPQKNAALDRLAKIQAMAVEPTDPRMAQFVDTYQTKILQASSGRDMQVVVRSLRSYEDQLKRADVRGQLAVYHQAGKPSACSDIGRVVQHHPIEDRAAQADRVSAHYMPQVLESLAKKIERLDGSMSPKAEREKVLQELSKPGGMDLAKLKSLITKVDDDLIGQEKIKACSKLRAIQDTAVGPDPQMKTFVDENMNKIFNTTSLDKLDSVNGQLEATKEQLKSCDLNKQLADLQKIGYTQGYQQLVEIIKNEPIELRGHKAQQLLTSIQDLYLKNLADNIKLISSSNPKAEELKAKYEEISKSGKIDLRGVARAYTTATQVVKEQKMQASVERVAGQKGSELQSRKPVVPPRSDKPPRTEKPDNGGLSPMDGMGGMSSALKDLFSAVDIQADDAMTAHGTRATAADNDKPEDSSDGIRQTGGSGGK